MKNTKNKNKRWTAEEDETLVQQVANHPNNLTYAYKVASDLLRGRTPAATAYRYHTLRARPNAPAIIAIATKTGVRMVNKKNTPIPRKARTDEMRLEVVMASIDKMSIHEKKTLVKYILEI